MPEMPDAPATDHEERIRRTLLTIFGLIIIAGLPVDIWNAWSGGHRVDTALLAGYEAASIAGFAHFRRTGRRRWFQTSQFFLLTAMALLIHLRQGGFIASQGVFIWAGLVPLAAAILASWRETALWFGLFLLTGGTLALWDPSLQAGQPITSPGVYFFAVIFLFFPATAATLIIYFLIRLDQARAELREKHARLLEEQAKSERLLLNILPSPIAERLKGGEEPIVDGFAEVTVLFADLVHFTEFTASVGPDRLVALLNEVFSAFDDIAARHGIEKIKTIGDAYMAAAGLPAARPDHAEVMARMALEMIAALQAFNARRGTDLDIRIGLNSGPVIAGVIGTHKFIYDLWGDTVNVASRMESHGAPGRIHVSETVWSRLRDRFAFDGRGEMEVKGCGTMRTWFLLGERHEVVVGPGGGSLPEQAPDSLGGAS